MGFSAVGSLKRTARLISVLFAGVFLPVVWTGLLLNVWLLIIDISKPRGHGGRDELTGKKKRLLRE